MVPLATKLTFVGAAMPNRVIKCASKIYNRRLVKAARHPLSRMLLRAANLTPAEVCEQTEAKDLMIPHILFIDRGWTFTMVSG